MTTVLWFPYGTAERESGLVTALGSYLSKHGEDVTQIRCPGALLACGRDHQAARKLSQCFDCIAESKAFAGWAGIKAKSLSQYLTAEDWSKARSWIYSVSLPDLMKVEFKGVQLSEMIGDVDPGSEPRYRELLISCVLCTVACEKMVRELAIEKALIANSADMLSKAVSSRFTALGVECILFEGSATEGSTVVRSTKFSRPYATGLYLDDLGKLRSDIRSWPPEVASEIHSIVQFLNTGGGVEGGE